ncbi:MAG TPA: hypothetical protein VN419_01990 [Humidesulfovibrio sp.]|uniref:hypothetical protein n=1 Tax=Humidesulfovibrio sp. TaxID=2910988 RepID=UPI002C8067C3|nr:hypothetical protein [Humidesulfovibrio sp.]HWR02763.1 hypothetical protein [Humidesulfovibrio sp.]
MNNIIAKQTDEITQKNSREPRPGKTGATADAAKPKAGKAVGSSMRQAAQTRVPRGPFKTLTIPESWYNSLHASSNSGDAADGEKE